MENLILEDLQCNNLMIYQKVDGYRFTSDAVSLANFVKVKNGGNLLDMCSGSGVIGILANAKNRIKHVYMVEIQNSLAEMCNKTIEYNNIQNITVLNRPLQGVYKDLARVHIDTIVCNPPYFKKEDGSAKAQEIAIAKQELMVSLEDIIKESSKILKDGGKFYMCHKLSRLGEIFYLLKKNKLEPKELKILSESKNDESILIKAVKMGEVGLKLV